MKKLIFSVLTLFAGASAYALPLGNPWDASLLCDGICNEGHCCTDWCDPCTNWCDAWSVRFGFYGDYVFNQHMEVDDKHNPSSIHEVSIDTNALFLAFNVFDRVDLFATLGATNIAIKTPHKAFATPQTPVFINDWTHIETDTHFSYSLGARGTIWEWGCFGFGAEFQYFHTRPRINFLYEEGDSVVYLNERLVYHEWQFGLGAAYRINIAACDRTAAIPYIGLRWGHSQLDMGDALVAPALPAVQTPDHRLYELENERDWGWALGVTLIGCEKWSVTVEGRWIHEKALHVNSQIRF